MAKTWYALYRPGEEEPEAVDFDKSDLVSLTLRRIFGSPNRGGPESAVFLSDELYVDDKTTRGAAWKRLKRKGWRIEELLEKFWEAKKAASFEMDERYIQSYHELHHVTGDPPPTLSWRTCYREPCATLGGGMR